MGMVLCTQDHVTARVRKGVCFMSVCIYIYIHFFFCFYNLLYTVHSLLAVS